MTETMTPWTDMRTPALAIVARGDQIEPVAPTEYKVHSQSHPEKTYTVQSFRDRWTCSCDFFAQTNLACIHILAVKYRNGFLESKEEPEKIVCAKCHSGDVVANGKRREGAESSPDTSARHAGLDSLEGTVFRGEGQSRRRLRSHWTSTSEACR